MRNNKIVLFLLLAIMALASFVRLWRLDSVPPGLWPDEALNGVQAVYEPGKIFYPENQGREGLIMSLDAFSFDLFGVSMFSFRLVPAIIGIFTVLGVYLVALELFRKKHLALLAAFFVATSFWHINFSRINFRAIMLPFVLCFSFYFLLLGIRKKTWWPFVLSGIFFGGGFYTYTAFRLSPLILFIVLFFWWLASRKDKNAKQWFGYSSLMLLATFFTALPIGLYFLMGHMQDFFGRMGGVSVFAQPNPIFAFLISLGRHLAMFNIYGDPNMRHNFSGDPELFWPVGLLFLAGWFVIFKQGLKTFKEKNWADFLPYAALLSWFFVMILPGALTYEGMPHSLRVIGVIPAAYIIAALGGIFAYEKLSAAIKSKKLLIALAAVFLAFAGFCPIYRYFYQWAPNPETKNAFSKDLVAMGNYLKNSPAGQEKYIIMYGGDLASQTVKLIALSSTPKEKLFSLWPNGIDSINTDKPALVLFMEKNTDDYNELSNKYPEGYLDAEQAASGIWVYKININK